MSDSPTRRLPAAVFVSRTGKDSRGLGRQQVPSLRLVPGTREAMLGQIRGERGEPPRDLVVARQFELSHQCRAVEPFVRVVDEEIEQSPWRAVADCGVG